MRKYFSDCCGCFFWEVFLLRFFWKAFLIAVVGLSLCSRSARAGWDWELKLRLSGGIDDNVRRNFFPAPPERTFSWGKPLSLRAVSSPLPPYEIVSDGVVKAALVSKLFYRHPRHFFRLKYGAGGEFFFTVPDEIAVLQKLEATYFFKPHRRIFLGGAVRGTDRRRINGSREYSLLAGNLSFWWLLPAGFSLGGEIGYNYFWYRHLEHLEEARNEGFTDGQRYSYGADFYSIYLKKKFGKEVSLALNYLFSRPAYGVKRNSDDQGNCVGTTRTTRIDLYHRLGGEIRVLYWALFSARYFFEVQQSSSCGDGFIGHRVEFDAAVEPFWEILVLVQFFLQFRNYGGAGPLGSSPVGTGEDDNLSGFTVRLSRPLYKKLSAVFRYSHYANLFGDSYPYARNLFTVGILLEL